MSLSSHQSAAAKSVDWLTPPEILLPLGSFDLDPCCPREMPWQTADTMLTIDADGLSAKWEGRVWMNPPFGSEAAVWLKKLAAHGNGIALVAARTETRMFFDSVWRTAGSILFVEGRPHFHAAQAVTIKAKHQDIHLQAGERAPFNSGAPICLVAYGEENEKYLSFSKLGKWVKL